MYEDLKRQVATLQQAGLGGEVATVQQDKAGLEREVTVLRQDKGVLEGEVATVQQDKTGLKEEEAIALHQELPRQVYHTMCAPYLAYV